MLQAKPRLRRALVMAGVAVAYYGAARVSLVLQLPGTPAPALWAPSGIGLAGVLLFGLDVWPAIAIGAFLGDFVRVPITWGGFAAAAAMAAADTVEPIIAVSLMRRGCRSPNPFARARDALWFLAAAFVACMLAATSHGVILQNLAAIGPDWSRSAWQTLLIAHFGAMVILGPALYAWGRNRRLELPLPRLLELAALALITIVGTQLLFGGWVTAQFAVVRPALPLLLWAAFRFGQRETSSVATAVSGLAFFNTWQATQAPSANHASASMMSILLVDAASSTDEWVHALQLFLCVTAALGLVVSAAVAERDAFERALVDSEQLFRTVFEQAAVGVALIETETGRFSRVNQRYCEIVGLSADDMTRTTFHAITHPDDLPADLDNMKRLVAGDVAQFSLEKRYRRSNGSTVWVNLTVSPTWKAGERPHYHIAIVEDITARKELETGLRNLNESLEARVRERTWQLEEQIRERQRAEGELRGSLREKETLLREIHHRVKNNLAVVSGLLYLESTHVEDEQTLRVLQESQHRVRSMAMVHEKLYRSGNLAAVNSHDYLDGLLDYLMQSYVTTSGRVTVRKRIDDLLLDVDTAIPCGLIFTELVTNSLKHAFPAGRTGTISVDLRNSLDGHPILTVGDDGIGLAPGMNAETASTLGWRLVRSLSRQLDADFTVRDMNPGTEATLQFQSKSVQPA